MQFHKTLRNMLLEEIERIEREQGEKEADMLKWREDFEADMGKEQDRLNARIDELSQERSQLSLTLNQKTAEFEERSRDLEAQIAFLEKEKDRLEVSHAETLRQMANAQNNLKEQRKSKTNDETKWETEREELFQEVARSNEVMEEKEELKEQELASLEASYKTTMEVQDQRIRMLNDEKRNLERSANAEAQNLRQKIDEAETEISTLRDLNMFMVETFQNRESLANDEVNALREELQNIQLAFDQREQAYVTETRQFTDRVLQLHNFIEKANARLEQGWDPEKEVTEAFKEQVQTLESQLETKDSQNEKLKQQLRKALNGQREEVTTVVKDFRKYLTHMSEIEKQTEEKLSEFLYER
jgi:DNA repair exonuclease SbcCD ATPase subunit